MREKIIKEIEKLTTKFEKAKTVQARNTILSKIAKLKEELKQADKQIKELKKVTKVKK